LEGASKKLGLESFDSALIFRERARGETTSDEAEQSLQETCRRRSVLAIESTSVTALKLSLAPFYRVDDR
jgi:hypothetical protein